VAPEFIPVLLGPAWTDVVLPFRLFTIGLLFRMSSKISDACTKAAGLVYSRALVQGAYAALVVLGAIVGQRWGVGGVAVAVSIAMGFNWVAMAALSRSVTGLSWPRFARANAHGALFAVVIGTAVALTVQAARAAHLGNIPVLLVAVVTAAVVMFAASRLRPEIFLGPHGAWAYERAVEVFGRISRRLAPAAARDPLASVGKANPK
jgi:PST family polysaccharide transporter